MTVDPVTGTCEGCGQLLRSTASFCAHCGRPRPAALPPEPAPWLAKSVPSPEAQPAPQYQTATTAGWLTDQQPWPYGEGSTEVPRRRRGAAWWALGLVLVVAVALGTWVLWPESDTAGGSTADAAGSATAQGSAPTAGPTRSSSSAAPSATDFHGPLAARATATAPSTSPDGVDAAGDRTTYVAAQMLDGDPATCWRMDGDGTGIVLTFRLDGDYAVSTVGLVNGYAKTDPASGADRYAQGRRITRVTWIVRDQQIRQNLVDGTRSVQTTTFTPVTTDVVQLRIDGVTVPGDVALDRTAISDVTLLAG
jgi:hypothetical protein